MKKRRASISIIPTTERDEMEKDMTAKLKVTRKKYCFSFLKDFTTFVPKVLVHNIMDLIKRENEAYSIAPFTHKAFAAVVIADVAGLTHLASEVQLEVLKMYINNFYKNIIEVIDIHRGDIIKFCGDSLVVSWMVDADSPVEAHESAVCMAANCCVQLVEACQLFPSTAYNSTLSDCFEDDEDDGETKSSNSNTYIESIFQNVHLNCGLACGMTQGHCVGAAQRWEYFLAGQAIDDAHKALAEAKINEVALSETAYTMLRHCSGLVDIVPCWRALEEEEKFYKLMKGGKHRFSRYENNKQQIRKSLALWPSRKPSLHTSPSSHVSAALVFSPPASPSSSPSAFQALTCGPSQVLLAAVKCFIGGRSTSESMNESDIIAPPSVYEVCPLSYGEDDEAIILDKYIDDFHIHVNNFQKLNLAGSSPIEIILESTLRHFVHESATEAIENANLEFLSELRHVVVLFVQVVGMPVILAQESYKKLYDIVNAILLSIFVKGGSLSQICLNDKGFVIVIAFGLAGSSHEDDCFRAVELAFLLRSSIRLEDNTLDLQIGIAFGQVFCGNIGTFNRCEYSLLGRSVNLAERLMQVSDVGGILVDENVFRAAENAFEFKMDKALSLSERNHNHVTPVYEAIGKINRSSGVCVTTTPKRIFQKPQKLSEVNYLNGNPFFCRENELAFISSILSETDVEANGVKRGPIACILQGIPSVGKSRLIVEALELTCKRKIEKGGSSETSRILFAEGSVANSMDFACILSLLEQLFVNAMLKQQLIESEETKVPSKPSLFRSRIKKAILAIGTTMKSKVENIQKSIDLSISTNDSLSAHSSEISSNRLCSVIVIWLQDRMMLNLDLIHFLFLGHDRNNDEDEDDGASDEHEEFIRKLFGSRKYPQDSDCASNIASGLSNKDDNAEKELSEMDSFSEISYDVPQDTYSFLVEDIVPFLGAILTEKYHPLDLTFTSSLTSSPFERFFTKLAGPIKKDLLIRIFAKILLLFANEGGVVVIDQLTYVDGGSLQVFTALVHHMVRGVFLGSSRNTTEKLRSGQVVGRKNAFAVSGKKFDSQTVNPYRTKLLGHLVSLCQIEFLKPFDHHDVEGIVNQVLSDQLIGEISKDYLIKGILDRTSGQPYLVTCLLRIISEELRLGNWSGRLRDMDSLPRGSTHILMTNFDRLEANDKVVMKIASVIGTSFSLRDLRDLLSELKLLKCIFDLESRLNQLADCSGLLMRDETVDEESSYFGDVPGHCVVYYFAEASIRLGMYQLMLETQRMHVHATFGVLVEKRFLKLCKLESSNSSVDNSSGLNTYLLRTAYHFCSSDNVQKRLEYHLLLTEYHRNDSDCEELCNNFESLLMIATKMNSSQLIEACLAPNHQDERDVVKSSKVIGRRKTVSIYTFDFSSIRVRNKSSTGKNRLITVRVNPRSFKHRLEIINDVSAFQIDSHLVLGWLAEIGSAYFKSGRLTAAYNVLLVTLWNLNPLIFAQDKSLEDLVVSLKVLEAYSLTSTPRIQSSFNSSDQKRKVYCQAIQLALIFGEADVAGAISIEALLDLTATPIQSSSEGAIAQLTSLISVGITIGVGGRNDKSKFTLTKLFSNLGTTQVSKGESTISRRLMCASERFSNPTDGPYEHSIQLMSAAEETLRRSGDIAYALHSVSKATVTLNFIGCHYEEHVAVVYEAWLLFISGHLSAAISRINDIRTYATETSSSQLLSWALELQLLIDTFALRFSNAELTISAYDYTNRSRRQDSLYGSSLKAFSLFIQNDMPRSADAATRVCQAISSKTSGPTTFLGAILTFFGLYAALGVIDAANHGEAVSKDLLAIELETLQIAAIKAVSAFSEHCGDASGAFPALESLSVSLEMKLWGIIYDIDKKDLRDMTTSQKKGFNLLRRVDCSILRHPESFIVGTAFLHAERCALCSRLRQSTFFTSKNEANISSVVHDSIMECKLAFRNLGLLGGGEDDISLS